MKNCSGENVVFVTGMGRSGTSVFSEWLSLSGVDFGKNLSLAEHINPGGNFEDGEFRRLHLQIMKVNGQQSWLDVPLDHQWRVPPRLADEMRTMADALNRRPGLVGVKEPLSTSLLREWHRLLPEAKFILVFRDASQVVDSVVRMERRIQQTRRNKIAGVWQRLHHAVSDGPERRNQRRALSTWVRSNREAAEFLLTLPPTQCLAIESGRWMAGSPAAEAIHSALGLEAPPVPASAVAKAGYFLTDPPVIDVDPEILADLEETEALLARCVDRRLI